MLGFDGANGSGGGPGGGKGRRGFSGGRPPVDVRKLFDRLPPHALEAEMSLLGSMILDPKVTGDIISLVPSGAACYTPEHAAIFDTLIELYDKHQSADLVQLTQRLRDRDVLEKIGGEDYLLRLAEQVPSSVNAPHYAKIVAEKWRLRKLIDAAGEILYEAFHAGEMGPEGAGEAVDRAEQRIFEIAEAQESGDAQRLSDLLQGIYDTLEDNRGSRLVTGVTTGYYDLDEMTSGLQPGELIIIAARPSMGKTALTLNLAEQIALGGPPGVKMSTPAPVAIFSMEMSRQSVAQRFMCARSGIDSHALRTNRLSDSDFTMLGGAMDELKDAPIFVDDTPALSILGLRARARRLVARHQVKCIMIDYLQLMTAPSSSESRQVEVSAISRGVKALARELNIPVVCLSQLNRAAEQREGHRPRMSDLRESGSIEQDADVIMLLHREEYYHQADPAWMNDPDNEDKIGLAELIIAKQRNGPTGVASMHWDSRTMRFKNRTSGPRVAPPPDIAAREERGWSPVVQTPGGGGGGAFTPSRKEPPPFRTRDDGPGLAPIEFDDDLPV